jgi:glycosyltransferase involved in cell wall biosynthesis
MGPEATVILLTKNARRYIKEVLEAVFAQSPQDWFEVVLVDSGSTDGTWEIIQSFPVRTHRISPETFNHGGTRNLGASLASPTSQYLIYLTQDATPLDKWLENLLRPLQQDEQVAGAFSRHVPRPGCAPSMARLMCTEWVQAGTPERVVKRIDDLAEYERHQAHYAYFSNTSSIIRRAIWEQFPFATVEFAEDVEWADRVLRAGYTLVYEPSSRVLHSHDYSLWQQLTQNVDHAMAMKSIHKPQHYHQLRPSLIWRRIIDQTQKDWSYVSTMDVSSARRAYWLGYAPLWQLMTELGGQIGAHAESLPAWLIARLSRQSRVRQGRG